MWVPPLAMSGDSETAAGSTSAQPTKIANGPLPAQGAPCGPLPRGGKHYSAPLDGPPLPAADAATMVVPYSTQEVFSGCHSRHEIGRARSDRGRSRSRAREHGSGLGPRRRRLSDPFVRHVERCRQDHRRPDTVRQREHWLLHGSGRACARLVGHGSDRTCGGCRGARASRCSRAYRSAWRLRASGSGWTERSDRSDLQGGTRLGRAGWRQPLGTLFLMAPLDVPRDGVGAVSQGCSAIFGRDSREVFVRASRIVAIPVTDILRP